MEIQEVHKVHLREKFKCLLRKFYTALYSTEGRGWVVHEEQIEEALCREAEDEEHEVRQRQREHEGRLLRRYQCLMEGLPHQGNHTLLREHCYTDLYITEGGGWGVHEEHEVRQIEEASWREAAQGRPIKCSDIFEHLTKQGENSSQQFKALAKEGQQSSEQVKPIGIVLTKGVAGIGKTVSVQKFIVDWAEGMYNQDLDYIFPLPFRELNLMKDKTISLIDLIRHFFPDVRRSSAFTSSEHRVMFIFDGLDECRLPLDFRHNKKCSDVSEPVPVDVLLTNLIQGNLLPSALLWITTRPAAANQIPHEYINQVTEIRGFNDPQKEEYFRRKISDESLASRTIAHLKSSRILYIMCHIPVFSWIIATVVEKISDGSGSIQMPRTLTQMYTHFLIIQVRIKNTKYTESDTTYTEAYTRDDEMISKLGKLAFQQLEKGNLIFYEEDLRECGIDVTEASVYSGVCTQIFREEAGLYQGKVFSFVHLSIQEFLAALYVFLSFISRQHQTSSKLSLFRAIERAFRKNNTSRLSVLFRAATLHDLHKTALDLALESKNGHLDLFLLFLLGLSLESNQSVLRHLLPQTSSQSQSSEPIVQLVKQKIRQQKESNRRINLFYCLNELNQHTVVEHIDRSSGTLSVEMLLPGQWETRKFEFETSEEYLDGFDLQKYIKTPEMDQTDLLSPDDVLQKLTDVFTSSTSAELEFCSLSEKSLAHLVSALSSRSSHLTQLTLKGTDIPSSFPSSLTVSSSAECHPDCKPWELSLQGYNLTEEIWNLVSALTSHTSTLSGKYLKKEDVERLCSTVSHQDCRLETLQLQSCSLSEVEDRSSLFSSLRVSSSAGCHPDCKPRELSLQGYNLTEEICNLVSALTSHTSTLYGQYLNEEEEVERLCSTVSHQDCRLETLKLFGCLLSVKIVSHLVSALTSHSRLTQLELVCVYIPDESAAEKLTALQNDPHYQMEISWYHDPYFPSEWVLDLSCRVLEDSEVTTPSAHHQQQSQEVSDDNFLKENPAAADTLASASSSHSHTAADTLASASSSHSHTAADTLASTSSSHSHTAADTLASTSSSHSHTVADTLASTSSSHSHTADALASASSSHSSDAAEMNLTNISQHLTGARLPSLRDGRICETCADIQDPGHWCVMPPSISLESGECVYTVSSAAGNYECSESGLRWLCAGPVTLQYRINKDELFWAQLQMLGYRPAGPLMEIKLLSGKLEEVHLPHSLCLGSSDPAVLGDAVRALHGDGSGVSLETCELSCFHGRLLAQHFSLWQLVVRLFFSVKSHCEVLIYENFPRPLVLHIYPLPSPSSAKQALQEEYRQRGARNIIKPRPNISLLMGSTLQLHTSCTSVVTPSNLPFTCNSAPLFFEVRVEELPKEFNMELQSTEENQPIWSVPMWQDTDYPGTLHLTDSQSRVTESQTDMTEQQLMEVAKLMGGEWRQVGILYLGLSKQELDKIQESERDVTMQRFCMLDQWRRHNKGKAGVSELYCCLNKDDVPNDVKHCLEGMLEGTSGN